MVHSRDALIPTEQAAEGVVVLQTARGPIDVDASIAPIVAALNAAGVETIASCSGHGHRPGNIALRDGRELVIARSFHEGRLIDGLFPIAGSGEALPPRRTARLLRGQRSLGASGVRVEDDPQSTPTPSQAQDGYGAARSGAECNSERPNG